MMGKNFFHKIKIQTKAIVFISALVFALVLPDEKAQAALWPGVDPMIMSSITKIYDLVQGAMLGAAKQAASVAINQQMDSLLSTGGSDGGPMFITDWDDYMVDQPKRDADVFINDYISETTAGKGSLSNYESAWQNPDMIAKGGYEGVGDGSFAYGNLLNKASASGATSYGGGNYISRLAQGALSATSGQQKARVTYEGDPSQMFNDGTMKNMSLYLSGINNPWAYNMHVQAKYQEKMENEKDVAKTMAGAYQGFTGVGDKNSISNPGSLIKDMKAGYQDVGISIIANANSLPEIITGAVSQATAKAVSMGIGSVQAEIIQKNSILSAQIGGQLNSGSTSQFFNFVNRPSGTTNTASEWKDPDSSAVPWKNPDAQ